MAAIDEVEQWEEEITVLATTEALLGGPTGPLNRAARQLANRLQWLLARALARDVAIDIGGGGTYNVSADEWKRGLIKIASSVASAVLVVPEPSAGEARTKTFRNASTNPVTIRTPLNTSSVVVAPGEVVTVCFQREGGSTSVAATGTSALRGQLTSAAADQTSANTQRFINKLQRGAEDVSLLVISDSTGNSTAEWVFLTAAAIAASFPTYTVIYHLWDDTTGAYDSGAAGPAITIQTVVGAKTLHVWNCSVGGTSPNYVLGARWPAAIPATAPDLVLISHGKNAGPAPTYGETHWRGPYLALVDSITDAIPSAGICVILQCPNTDSNEMALKARVYEEIASIRGLGCIDVHQAFVDTGEPASYMIDTLHPSTTGAKNGSLLWSTTVLKALSNVRARGGLGKRDPSSLTPPDQLLINGSFANWTDPAQPSGWVLSLATATKDTRAGFSERNGYGMRLQATGAGVSSIGQSYADYAALRGKTVTLYARVRIPTGQSTNAARVQISDGVNTSTTIGPVEARDGFAPVVLTHKVADTATQLTVTLFCDTAGNPTADVTYSCAFLTLGSVPRMGTVGPSASIVVRPNIKNNVQAAVVAANPTPATLADPVQYSPSIDCSGAAFDGTQSRSCRFAAFALPIVGVGTITGVWNLYCYIDGVQSTVLQVSNAGSMTVPGNLTVNGVGSVVLATTAGILLNGNASVANRVRPPSARATSTGAAGVVIAQIALTAMTVRQLRGSIRGVKTDGTTAYSYKFDVTAVNPTGVAAVLVASNVVADTGSPTTTLDPAITVSAANIVFTSGNTAATNIRWVVSYTEDSELTAT